MGVLSSPMLTCTWCDKPARIKGLCKTHYNQTLPNRHKPRTTTCVVCGATVARWTGGGGRKYGATCSLDCRYTLTWGERCDLPADHWARWYGATCPLILATLTCDWCGQAYATRHPTSTVCSSRCREARRWQRRTARMHNAEGEYRWTQVVHLWLALDKRCAYCLQPLALTLMQVEHVTPLTRGGRNDLSNLLPSCGDCNAEKSDRTPTEWDADRAKHGLEPRAAHIHSLDPLFAHLITTPPTGLPYRLRIAA